jgi:hypothetical protein
MSLRVTYAPVVVKSSRGEEKIKTARIMRV